MLQSINSRWKTWFLIFLTFSFIGWIYELLVFRFELGYGYLNRGFLFGPYLPVYGFGGLLMLVPMLKLKHHRIMIGKLSVTPVVCFIIAVFVATAAELLTSYLMELTIGEWLWDYTKDIPNFQGRIALKSSLRFGILGLMGLYGVHPLLTRLTESAKDKYPRILNLACCLLLVIFLADVAARPFLGSNYVGP